MSNSSILQIIKQAAVEAVNSSFPCDIHVGVIKSVNPLVLHATDIDIPNDFIVLASSVHNSLSVNDKVIVAVQSGGQRFFILDKVVT